MATINEVFTHSTPQTFADEAPVHSISIGERIAQGGLDLASAIIRGKYGDKSTIPGSGGAAAGGSGAMSFSTTNNSGMFFLIVALLVLFLLMRR